MEALLVRPVRGGEDSGDGEYCGGSESSTGGTVSGEGDGARDGASDLVPGSPSPPLPALPLATPRPLPRPRPSPPRPRPPRRCGGGGMTARSGGSPPNERAERRPSTCLQGVAAITNGCVN